MYEAVVMLHALAGTVALASFWTAGLARKGSPLHRRAGRIYLQAMRLILLTALPIVGALLMRERLGFALFFAYLVVIVSESVWTSLRALQLKRDPARYFGTPYRAAAVVLLASGAGMLLYGLSAGNLIFAGFAFVGLGRGGAMLVLSRRPPTPRWSLSEHLGAMIGNGVATHIAFLLIGLGRLLPETWAAPVQTFGWLAPLGVALVAGVHLTRKYVRPPALGA
ncbi:MAG: hypothetical protein VYC42_07630 [Pseudomonadota bacterium]|nr:hypothetical protein [Pseudomonadota bacterium]